MYYLPLYYLSSAMFIFIWLTGFVCAIDLLARELDKHLSLQVTARELRLFVYWQLGVLLVAVVAFKWVVLTSYGDGYHVFKILSGHGSDTVAYPIAILSLLLVFYGGWKILKLVFGHFHFLAWIRPSSWSPKGVEVLEEVSE